jgi:hypothetical protein
MHALRCPTNQILLKKADNYGPTVPEFQVGPLQETFLRLILIFKKSLSISTSQPFTISSKNLTFLSKK